MRSWFALACLLLLLLPLPSLAGPQDPWTVDPKASGISFSVAQVGSIVSGRFPTWTGEIVLDPAALATARIDIKIDTRPVSANNRDVDSLMKGPNFLDVQKFPEARFVATSISGSGERYEARGKLTPATSRATSCCPSPSPSSTTRLNPAASAARRVAGSSSSASITAWVRTNGRPPARSPTR
jgi:hypothetical protein